MLNIVVPMAGAGSRFQKAGYNLPKPLISVNGIPMIRVIIENLKPSTPHRFIFICQKAHADEYDLQLKMSAWAPGSEVVMVNGLTEGAACTVLAAERLINSDEPLMIANSDQYVDVSIDEYLEKMGMNALDGIMMTMRANDPKWSFVGFDETGLVSKVVEKEVISDEATVGIYNFKRGRDFVAAADEMIEKDLRVNNEFYVAPVYNQLVDSGSRIGVFNVGSVGNGMYGLGTPDDLNIFLYVLFYL